MELLSALGLENLQKPIVCLAGAGGKTTLLYMLCAEMRRCHKKTAAFTTTHIMKPGESESLALIVDDDVCFAQTMLENGKTIIAGTQAEDGKIKAPAEKMLAFLMENADAVIAEADGSRNLPLKFPNENEPCLINCESRLFVVAGLSAIGKPLCEVCHRWPLAMAACGISGQQSIVTENMMAHILANGYKKYKPMFVLNQADDELSAQSGRLVKKELLKLCGAESVIISLQEDKLWL